MQDAAAIGSHDDTGGIGVERRCKRMRFQLFHVEDVTDRHRTPNVRYQQAYDGEFIVSRRPDALMAIDAEHRETSLFAQNNGLYHVRDALWLRQFGVNALGAGANGVDKRSQDQRLAVGADFPTENVLIKRRQLIGILEVAPGPIGARSPCMGKPMS